MTARSRLWYLVLIGSLRSLACDEATEERAPVEASAKTPPVSLLDPSALAQALTAMTDALGNEITALELDVYPSRVVLQAQDPASPVRILQYVYRNGALETPRPVRLQGTGKLEENTFRLHDARLDRIPELTKRAIAAVDGKHGRVSHVLLRRNLPHDVDVRFRVYVTSPIRDGYLDATADGELIDPPRP